MQNVDHLETSNPPIQVVPALDDRYAIVEQLGKGGCGTVYKAQQLATGQTVAIKMVHRGDCVGSSETWVRRFAREMRLCATLHHPNIVRMIDSGQTASGHLFAVFEHVPGEDLGALLAREGSLTPRETKHIMLQVLDALCCAHAHGIVHRDLKPQNIMIIATGARRNAVVLDFGISGLAHGYQGSDYVRLTTTGDSLGTPGYAAPEQLRGGEACPESDLFAWGLVFLECLTGMRSLQGASLEAILFEQLGQQPIGLPAALQRHPLGQILARALVKDVERRKVTAQQLFAALEACPVHDLSPWELSQNAASESEAGSDTLRSVRTSGTYWTEPTMLSSTDELLDGECRQVTALCCILTVAPSPHDTDSSNQQDELWRGQRDSCIAVGRRLGGHVAAALGDQVLMLFGVPHAEEDDAWRAARAALSLISETRTRDEQVSSKGGTRLQIRIGLHTGPVTITRTTRTGNDHVELGTTPARAAQLARIAEPGQVAASGDTHRILRRAFDFVPLEAGAASGEGAESGPIYYLQAGARAVDWASARPGDESILVGRESEMDLLRERWQRTRAGSGQLSLITGEAGIGKTRLARELRQSVIDDGCAWFECRCFPEFQNTPLYPVRELLRRMIDLDPQLGGVDPAGRLHGLLLRYGLNAQEAMPLLAPMLSIPLEPTPASTELSTPPERRKSVTLHGLLTLLLEMAAQQPVLLVVEDLHWADPTTIELLGLLAKEIPSVRLFAMFTTRPDFAPAFGTATVLQIPLGRLDAKQTGFMLRERTKGKSVPEHLLEQAVARTEGVPLFVEEVARLLVESAPESPGSGRPVRDEPWAPIEVPATLRGLFQARLDRLGASRETCQIAAALGREFTVPLLAAVTARGAQSLQEDLDRLALAGLFMRRRGARHPSYVFRHALIQDASYECLSTNSRRRIHAAAARALEEQFPDVVASQPALLAYHHDQAGERAMAIGYALRAANLARENSANLEAIANARKALGWLDALPDERARAELEVELNGILMPTLLATQGYTSVELKEVIARSEHLIERLGDSPQKGPTLWAAMFFHHMRSDRQQARVAAEHLVEHATAQQDNCQLANALIHLGTHHTVEGSFASARPILERGLSLYDCQAHRSSAFVFGLDPKVGAHISSAILFWYLGLPDAGLGQARAALEWARQVKHAASIDIALFYLASIHHLRREPEKALEWVLAQMDFSQRNGLVMNSGYSCLIHAWATTEVERARKVIEMHRASGCLLGLSYYLSLLADTEAKLGRYDAALNDLDQAIAFAEQTGERYHLAELLRLKADVILKRSPAAETESEMLLRAAIALAHEQAARMPELQATVDLCRMLVGRGEIDAADLLLEGILPAFTEGFDTPALQQATALRAQLQSQLS